ncbi:MAG: Ca2+-binding RTX toxin-like protein [Paracoccaceae bacterium]
MGLTSIGSLGGRMGLPNLVAQDDGGFSLFINVPVGNLIGDDRLTRFDFIKNGVAQGTPEILHSGWIDNVSATETPNGVFITYRDRGADIEYVGKFYNQAGNLLKTFDFEANPDVFGFPHPDPQATLLSNGNLAVVLQKTNLDGSFLQIFRPDGSKVGGEKSLGNIPLNVHPKVIETHPDGGFVVAHAPVAVVPGSFETYGAIVIQKYNDQGKKVGPKIVFDTDSDDISGITPSTNFDVAFTKNGLIAIVWTGEGTTTTNGTDVYFAMLSANGNVIVGPQAANVTLNENQLDVEFTYLKNGNLFLTFKDDATVQFSHVASIQGRFIVEPDYLWEGNKSNNTKNGGGGNDRMFDSEGNDKMTGGAGADQFIFYNVDFGHDVITDFQFGVDTLDMGVAARALDFSGGDIVVQQLAGGVRFKVDADNWVLVKGAEVSDFQTGDYIIEDPFALI